MSIKAVFWNTTSLHATENEGEKTLCGRKPPSNNSNVRVKDNLTELIDCKNCLKVMERRDARERKTWGGPRPGAGRPPLYKRVPVDELELLKNLKDKVADFVYLEESSGFSYDQYNSLKTALEAVEESGALD